MQKYTVHNLPFYLQPFLHLFGWVGGIGLILLNFIFRSLCRIEFVGKEHLVNTPNHIFSLWHENVSLFFIAHPRFKEPNIWLTFPLWYMKPTHVIKKLIGVKELAFGASGHDGKAALQKVLNRLSEGWSTFLTPDGPKGPLKVAKNGVLIMSLKTGTPIIPIRFQLKKAWRLRSWDRKRYPPFFSTLVIIYGTPRIVTKANFEEVRKQISEEMSDAMEYVKGEKGFPKI